MRLRRGEPAPLSRRTSDLAKIVDVADPVDFRSLRLGTRLPKHICFFGGAVDQNAEFGADEQFVALLGNFALQRHELALASPDGALVHFGVQVEALTSA